MTTSSLTNNGRIFNSDFLSEDEILYIPYKGSIGSMLGNWLGCRKEISSGAKLVYARLAQFAGKDGNCFPKLF